MEMQAYKLGSVLGTFHTYDHAKTQYVGSVDFTGKTILEFIKKNDEDQMCTISWLAVLNGADKVYVVVPSATIKKTVEFVKYMHTPKIGHSKIIIVNDHHDLPDLEFDYVFDPIEEWKGRSKAKTVLDFKTVDLGMVETASSLKLLDFEKDCGALSKVKNGATLMTSCVMKAVVAAYMGAKVHLKVKDNFKSVHNFIMFYLPITMTSQIKIVPDF